MELNLEMRLISMELNLKVNSILTLLMAGKRHSREKFHSEFLSLKIGLIFVMYSLRKKLTFKEQNLKTLLISLVPTLKTRPILE